MAAEVVVNAKEIQVKLHDMESAKLLDETILTRIGDMVKLFITSRTQKGKDVDGFKFKKYSAPHKFFREEQGYQVDHVDLFMSGQMQSSIAGEADVVNQKVTVKFSDAQQAAKAHGLHFGATHRWGNNPKVEIPARHFFDVSKSEMEFITKEVEEYISDKISE